MLLQINEENFKAMHLSRGYPAHLYYVENIPLSTIQAEKDMTLYVTRLLVKANSIPITEDRSSIVSVIV